jgi:hypothetical protein
MEEFRIISDFPMYAVSNYGKVVNVRRNVEMVLSRNANQELTVGMWRDGKQHRRAVRGLVARAFVQGETELFNTPVLLDGDRDNVCANNIVWRPRWFALMYMRQFDIEGPWWFAGPVKDVISNVEYENIVEAAIGTGSLVQDIRHSILNQTRVFPEGGIFAFS